MKWSDLNRCSPNREAASSGPLWAVRLAGPVADRIPTTAFDTRLLPRSVTVGDRSCELLNVFATAIRLSRGPLVRWVAESAGSKRGSPRHYRLWVILQPSPGHFVDRGLHPTLRFRTPSFGSRSRGMCPGGPAFARATTHREPRDKPSPAPGR